MFYGVDRRSIVEKLLYGYADVTGGTVPPAIGGFVSAIPVDTLFNPELAREELRKSTYKGEPIELLVHEQGNSEQIGQFFQDQMKTLGVNIQLTKLDFNSVIGRMVKGEAAMYGMFFDYVLSSPQPILINLFSSAKRPVPNFWQFSDPAVDAALESLRNEPQEAGVKKSAEIEAQIMAQAPAIFLYRQRQLVIHSKRYGEFPINPHGLFRFNLLKPLPG
jgi:peptide/nickel transport system substrate-binding protein